MKKLMAVLMVVIGFQCFGINNQSLDNIDITTLSQSELIDYQRLKQKALKVNESNIIEKVSVESITNYGELGKAFGEAFNGCWSTISDDAEAFGKSDAGKLTMFLIAWKIMGTDAIGALNTMIHYVFGGMLYIIFIFGWLYIINSSCKPTYKIASKSGWFIFKKTTYSDEIISVSLMEKIDDENGSGCFMLGMSVGLFILLILASVVTFSG